MAVRKPIDQFRLKRLVDRIPERSTPRSYILHVLRRQFAWTIAWKGRPEMCVGSEERNAPSMLIVRGIYIGQTR